MISVNDRRAFTETELPVFFDAVKSRVDRSPERNYEREVLYRTMLGTGFRSSETVTRKVYHLLPDHIVINAATEKNRKGTHQPISKTLSELLHAWVKVSKKRPEDVLFNFTRDAIYNEFVADCLVAGIEREDSRGHILVPYSFRHTFGTKLARAGVPLTTTQKLMRHSSPVITARYYIDVTPQDTADALAKIE